MIETKDLILRQGSADDWLDLYRNLWIREEVFRYMFSKPSLDEEAARKKTAAYAEMHKEIETEFFVCEKPSGQAIGIAGIKELKPGDWTPAGCDAQSKISKNHGRRVALLTARCNLV